MAKKRKVNNLLALAVLSAMIDRPKHRYEIAHTLRERGKDQDMAIKWGSLYTVVQSLEKVGFLEIVGSERDGARPERVIYQITEAGRAELLDWTRELVAVPEPEQHRFIAGLSILSMLPPDEVVELLGRRVDALNHIIDNVRTELGQVKSSGLPRLFVVESEFGLAMLEAEAAWAHSLREELIDGTFPDLDWWRRVHAEQVPVAEVVASVERGMTRQEPS
ncbi:PadR family transcriptional regulator [Nocardia tenerifensis]|uniref:PadR family transcriptional regulator n=1 Tax=Nocardia tenerifensis TaxID=228006 RepID=A0A318JXK6_9NOCA|nr:PadR family transcriptional regulator [Nocardia tenerifensis]PXX61489.1 PadR family transcriptional regulator [Nocardia tenerifensis]